MGSRAGRVTSLRNRRSLGHTTARSGVARSVEMRMAAVLVRECSRPRLRLARARNESGRAGRRAERLARAPGGGGSAHKGCLGFSNGRRARRRGAARPRRAARGGRGGARGSAQCAAGAGAGFWKGYTRGLALTGDVRAHGRRKRSDKLGKAEAPAAGPAAAGRARDAGGIRAEQSGQAEGRCAVAWKHLHSAVARLPVGGAPGGPACARRDSDRDRSHPAAPDQITVS